MGQGASVEQEPDGGRSAELVRRGVLAVASLMAVAAAWLGGRWLYGYDDPADAVGALMLVLIVMVALEAGRRRESNS